LSGKFKGKRAAAQQFTPADIFARGINRSSVLPWAEFSQPNPKYKAVSAGPPRFKGSGFDVSQTTGLSGPAHRLSPAGLTGRTALGKGV
jgi:hypothetical protein